MLPVRVYGSTGGPGFSGAIGFRYSRASGFEEVGRITHGNGAFVDRSIVVGDTLFTASEQGVKANGLRSFALREWIEYPAVPS